jgi:hypothetical protein
MEKPVLGTSQLYNCGNGEETLIRIVAALEYIYQAELAMAKSNPDGRTYRTNMGLNYLVNHTNSLITYATDLMRQEAADAENDDVRLEMIERLGKLQKEVEQKLQLRHLDMITPMERVH